MASETSVNLREAIRSKPWIGIAVACGLTIAAVGVLAANFRPTRPPDLSKAFYTTDNGATWFADSAFEVPPFDHDGKPAVGAHVYSYANGNKQFCAYLSQYTPEGKKKLEQALDVARQQGKPESSVWLYQDRTFINKCTEAKVPGQDNPWVLFGSPKSNAIFTVSSPDGSVIDDVLAK